MQNDSDFAIQTNSYISQFKRMTDNVIYFERQHTYVCPYQNIDVFGRFYMLAFGVLKPGQIFIHRFGKEIPLVGSVFIYVPAYSLIQWIIHAPELCWKAFFSEHSFSTQYLSPILLKRTDDVLPKNLAEIRNLVQTSEYLGEISKIEDRSPVAEKMKAHIDLHLGEALKIQTMAENFGLSLSHASRIFKKTYGLSPVTYRNKLRIFDSMFQLLIKKNEKTNISDIAFGAGFGDLSRFNKQFKKIANSKPSQYKYRSRDK